MQTPQEPLAMDRAFGSTVFGADAAGYEAGRPDYPEALFDLLAERCHLAPGARVLEIGPGTGQATRRLLGTGVAALVAVEPDPVLAAHLTRWGEPRLAVQCGPFGADVPGDGSFDLIVAATSFHWLESGAALARVRQLLRPGGAFAMWWNVFHEPGDDPLFDALFEGLPRPPSLLSGRHYSLDADGRCAELAGAGFGEVSQHMLTRQMEMTPASLCALFATFSVVRQLPSARRGEWLAEIERMARENLGERFPRTFRTPLYTARSPG